jgi:amino acid transporter
MNASQPSLARALSLGGASAISTGLAFAAINFLGVAQLLDNVTGPLAWLAVLAGGVVVLAVRALFAELNGMYPTAAGIRLWMMRAMSDRIALIITLSYITTILLVIAADAFIIGEAVAHTFASGHLLVIGYVAVLLAGATWVNLRGIKLAAAAEAVVTTAVVILTVLIGAVAIVHHGSRPHLDNGVHSNPLSALVMGIFLYTAFEWVTTNAEEVAVPRVIPQAMLVAIAALFVSQSILAVAMGTTLDGSQRGTAYPQLLVARAAMGHAGMMLMLGVTALTAVNTFNGGFVTMSRFMYAVAREGKLPRVLARLNARAVPVVPVVALGITSFAVAALVSITGTWQMLVSVGAALEMVIYAAAAFVVWRLRSREPDTPRPYRFRGRRMALVMSLLFAGLALLASLTVGSRTSVTPLVTLVLVFGVVTVYVLTYVPRLERREAEELAARRAARAAARAAQRPSAGEPG